MDGTYCPMDMIEIPGGSQVGRYGIRRERPEIGLEAWIESLGSEAIARCKTALSRLYMPDSDPEIKF